MKKLPLFLLGLLILNAVFVFCAFDMGVTSHCPLGLSMTGNCIGENAIQSAAHHISTMLDSTLAVLPFLISLAALAIFTVFIFKVTPLRPSYNLAEIKTPSLILQKSLFEWLGLIRQRDPENFFRAYNVG